MIIVIKDLESKYSSVTYYRASVSICRKINEHFGWKQGQIDTELYEQNFDKIVHLVCDSYKINSPEQLSSKFAAISCPCKLVGYDGALLSMCRSVRSKYVIPSAVLDKPNIPWDQMVKLIRDVEAAKNNKGASVICICYKHGYVLRCNEIAMTSIEDKPEYNFLDTKNLIWYIRDKNTKNRKDREFKVSQDFINELTPHIRHTGFLIGKINGQPYTSQFRLAMVDITEFSVNEVRNSYETMNIGRDDIDEQEKKYNSENVLGHSITVARGHYTPQVEIKVETKKKIKPVIKLKPKPVPGAYWCLKGSCN